MEKIKIGATDIILITAAFLWGLNPAVVKIGLAEMNPLPYTMIRLIFASIVSFLILIKSNTYKSVNKKDLKSFIYIGFFGMLLFQVLFTYGAKYSTAANTSLILCLVPISVIFINYFFKHEKINSKIFIGVVLTIIGVICIVLGASKGINMQSDMKYLGAFLIVGAQVAFAIYTVYAKDLLEKYSPYQVSTYIFIIATILFFIISLPQLINAEWANITWKGWISCIFSGVFSITVANTLWIWGVKKIGSTKTSIYNNLPPVFSIFAGFYLLGENFGIYQIFGAVLIIIGLYIARKQKNKIEN